MISFEKKSDANSSQKPRDQNRFEQIRKTAADRRGKTEALKPPSDNRKS